MEQFSFTCTAAQAGLRLDQFLQQQLPHFSRTRLKESIKLGLVKINGITEKKASRTLIAASTITFTLPERQQRALPSTETAEAFFAKQLIIEHQDFVIINKPAGLVTHPPSPKTEEVALSDLMHVARPQSMFCGEEGREGIVHRLDKDTSGLILIAKNMDGYRLLRELFCSRNIQKTYIAITAGHTDQEGVIPVPILRDPLDPKKMMACYTGNGAPAETQFFTLGYGTSSSLIAAQPKTGRTHQVRVHCAHMGHPLLGDTLYGTRSKSIKRHALHAYRLQFEYKNQSIDIQCPIPEDMLLCAQSEQVEAKVLATISKTHPQGDLSWNQ